MQLSSYDQSKRMILQSNHFQDNTLTHIIASIFSGLKATTIVNPADVIKTRILCDSTTKNCLYFCIF